RLRGVTIVEAAFPGVNTTWPNFGIPFSASVSLATHTSCHSAFALGKSSFVAPFHFGGRGSENDPNFPEGRKSFFQDFWKLSREPIQSGGEGT
ncbi:MAG: hypothetical protein ACK5PZ_20065, partial [Pirellula sp.]